jgi:galactokinase
MTVQELKAAFEAAYGKAAEAVYFSPGRVNLIGEHVDYNGGSVFPCALSFGTYLLMAKNSDNVMKFKVKDGVFVRENEEDFYTIKNRLMGE